MKKTCLNGWWDFCPVYQKDLSTGIPAQGWLKSAYLVPSLWRKPLDCVKTHDEEYFRDYRQSDLSNIENLQFLYDDFGYPNSWTATKEAWVRRYLDVERLKRDTQYLIVLEAVMPYSALYINGHKVSSFVHPTLPYKSDVTAYLKTGKNEIVVHIYDYDKDEFGRYMTPTGTMSVADNAGIWQDVYFIERSNVYVDDCFVKTYVDDMRIETEISVANSSERNRNITIKSYILDGKTKKKVLVFKDTVLYLKKCDVNDFTVSGCFPDAVLWEPSNPKLYEFIIELYDNENEIYKHRVSFGFREIKIKGKHIMLNNRPLHLFSDWGHKVTTYCYTKEWVESWFHMIKDGNMNHTRLHTCPHPSFILDMADKEGILITGEAGLHGSGGYQASNNDEYWINAEDHIRRFVKRDRNHPSLILWSVENEMRWNQKGEEQKYPEKTVKNLPKLKQLINTLDPTRPAYHEGDSSLWDETEQDIISRHYGKDAVGADWWDRSKPLHIGEMALYHYEGPNTALNLIGDKAYIDHKNVDIASAEDAKMIIEYGRTIGVCCFGPWNQSCLKLIRKERKDKLLKYPDFTAPGIKPLNVKAHTSEFTFWKKGRNYAVQKSFDIQKEAFRPFAVIDYSMKNGYFKDELIKRTVYIVNDTASDCTGILTVRYGEDIVQVKEIQVKKGYEEKADVEFCAFTENDSYITNKNIVYEFRSENELLDRQVKKITVYNIQSEEYKEYLNKINNNRIVVYGDRLFNGKMEKSGIRCINTDNLNSLDKKNTDILIIAENVIRDNDTIHRRVDSLLSEGVKILLMEQEISIFKGINLINKPVLTAFKTNTDYFLNKVKNSQLCFWGKDPYVKISNDSYVSSYLYQKSDTEDDISYILETGEGSFGRGDLSYSPLLMLKYRNSVLIANQMNITEKLNVIPQANHLLVSLLFELSSYDKKSGKKSVDTYILKGDEYNGFENIKEQVLQGANLLISNLTESNIKAWNDAIGTEIRLIGKNDIFNCRIKKKDNIVDCISNYELNGINTFSYSKKDAKNYNLCDFVIFKDKKLKTVVETCQNSMMKELFVHNGHTELRRAYTVSKYSYSAKKMQEYDVIAYIKYGKGKIYFNQLKNDIDDSKHKRMLKRIIYNLKGSSSHSSFDYEKTESIKSSDGYPINVNLSKVVIDDCLWDRYVSTTVNNNERMAHKKTVSIGDWQLTELSTFISIDDDISKGISYLITFNIFSSEPRKNIGSNLGVPNPEDLTFLHVTSNGIIRLAVNGQDYGKKRCMDDLCVFSDISLEKGINYVMISWTPDGKDTNIKLDWKNINLKPESNLEFFC